MAGRAAASTRVKDGGMRWPVKKATVGPLGNWGSCGVRKSQRVIKTMSRRGDKAQGGEGRDT